MLFQPANNRLGVPIRWEDWITHFLHHAVADDDRPPLQMYRRLRSIRFKLEGREMKCAGEYKVAVAEQRIGQAKPLDSFPLVVGGSGAQAEYASPQRQQLLMMIAK